MRNLALLGVVLMGLVACLSRGNDGKAGAAINGGPAVLFTDVRAGPVKGGPGDLGVPIAIFGKGFGALRGDSKVTIGGLEVAAYLAWGEGNAFNPALDMIVVQPGALVKAGPVVVTVGGKPSNADQVFRPTNGTVYAVAPNGSDSAPCSLAQPCSSILHAVGNVMKPGDALLVRGGPVNDDEIWIRDSLGHSGTADQPKIVRNYPGEQPRFVRADRPVIVDANFITFAGFEFENGKSIGVGSIGAKGNRVVNNRFRGRIAWDAIGTHGDDITLAGNVCEVASSSVGTQGHCYYISHGRGIRLLYNVAKGAPGYGIHIFDQERSKPDIQRVIEDVLVEGNLLSASTQRSGLIVAMGDEGGRGNRVKGVVVRNNIFFGNNFAGVAIGGNVQDVLLEHNTFFGNGRQGLTIYDEASINGVQVRNNLFDQTGNTNCRQDCSWYEEAHVQRGTKAQNVVLEGNFYAPGPAKLIGLQFSSAKVGLAGFVNTTALDFHLTDSSAAMDQGVPSSTARDFDGRARPAGKGFDPGAFEHP